MAAFNPEEVFKYDPSRRPDGRPDSVDLIGPWFDRPRGEPAPKTLIVCAAPRTGSRELARVLMAAGIGVAHEYCSPNYARVAAPRWGLPSDALTPEHIEEYIAELRRRRSAGGVFAINLQFSQFRSYLSNKHGRALFDGAVVVHLFRADVVRQFVSLHKAAETGRWDFSDRPTRPGQDRARLLERQVLQRMAAALVIEDAGFRRLFILSGIRPIFVESEEFFQKPRTVVEKISRALAVNVDQERLSEAIAVSKAYDHGSESEQQRQQILLSIMGDWAFDAG